MPDYRFWLSALLWIVVVLVPVYLVMNALDIAPAVAQALWTLHVMLALAVLLAFVRLRQTVVRVVGRAFALRRPVVFSLIFSSPTHAPDYPFAGASAAFP